MKSMMVASSAVTAVPARRQKASDYKAAPRILRRMTFKILLQYILPHRFLSRLVYWGTRRTFAPWKNWLIGTIVRNYGVDMAEAAQPDPLAYQHFNAFFTRKLKPGARQADA